MLKSSISPAAVQSLFDSCSNAQDKGQAQWFTPPEWARVLALPLNDYRPVIADLMCGNGSLLRGAQTKSVIGKSETNSVLLGCDLDASGFHSAHAVNADLAKFYSKLKAVDWKCDTFVLNPGWDLHLYREGDTPGSGLAALADSECPAVREAFAAHDGRTPRECIDSTIATLCIALDRSSPYTDGCLIANESTLQRLILGEGGRPQGPHRALAAHVWAHLVIPGNLCQSIENRKSKSKIVNFQTGVIWFARGHNRGLQQTITIPADCSPLAAGYTVLEVARGHCENFRRNRYTLRDGPEAARYLRTEDTVELWSAAREEHLRCLRTATVPEYNLWFDAAAGVIRTNLSVFDTASGRVDKAAAAALHGLNGRQPIQLVVQRNTRRALEEAVQPGSPWSVDPALTRAIETAIVEYNQVRAPLYPLPEIQRLGYLDECDDITCMANLKSEIGNRKLEIAFRAGAQYPIRSTTVAVRRTGQKLNTVGAYEDVEWNGQELAFFITDEAGVERCFMEERLRAGNVKINLVRPGTTGRKDKDLTDECAIDFNLQQLVDAFVIPEVPDVATLNPKQYAANLELLNHIEQLTA